MGGLVLGLLAWIMGDKPNRIRWRIASSGSGKRGLLVGLAAELTVGLPYGLVVGLAVGLAVRLTQANVGDTRTNGPLETWRQDVATGPVGGFVGGLVFALVGLMSTTVGRLLVFQALLALRRRTPWRLMQFLEDARARHVLRTVGPIYQFRHATLQDRLAQRPITPTAQSDRGSPANRGPR